MSSSRSICINVLLLVCVVVSVSGEVCPLSSLKVVQTAAGPPGEIGTQWKVDITNDCFCGLSELVFQCPKFQAGIPTIPKDLISINDDGNCVIKSDAPLYPHKSFVFTYTHNPVDFLPLSFTESCS